MRPADLFSIAAILIAVLGFALTLGVTRAVAESNNVVFRQVTNITTGNIQSAKLRMQEGNDIAFVSTGDVMGPGTATALRQVYLWREGGGGSGGTITRVTPNNACESYDASRPTDTTLSDRPEIIALVSRCDYDPQGDNSDGNPEIFFYDVDSGRFYQMTDTPSTVENAEPFPSDSGRCLVFRSNGNLDNNTPAHPHYDVSHPGPGFENADGSDEIFFYGKINGGFDYPQNGVFTQVSNGPAGTTSSHPVINGYYFPRQCQTVAYQSDHNQLNTGVAGQLIWVYNTPSSALEEIGAAEIPHGWPPGIYSNPMISGASPFARGPHIVFESAPDLWNNLSEGTNIFDWRAFHPRMTQYTNIGAGFAVSEPQVGDGGGVISFSSNGEVLSQKHPARGGAMPPFNADANSEIFRLKGRRRVSQLTQTSACQNLHSSLKDDGKRLAFISTCDLIPGENSLHRSQIYLWGLEKADSPLLQPNGCLQAQGCCLHTPKNQTCYNMIEGKKPKIDRPNCVERNACSN